MALGGEPGTAHFIAPKPKGMWWRTYQRKVDEIETCEAVASLAFVKKYARFIGEDGLKRLLGD